MPNCRILGLVRQLSEVALRNLQIFPKTYAAYTLLIKAMIRSWLPTEKIASSLILKNSK